MIVIPAIDLNNGQAVRLYKGDFEKKIVYNNNPVGLANRFEALGAKYLHIVDLNGAKTGNSINLDIIRAIRQNVNTNIEVGGGIRNEEKIKLYLEDLNINRIILGTVALQNPSFVKDMIKKYGANRIVVGVDIKNENVSICGWQNESNINYLSFIKELEQIGVKYIIVTDISKDGTLDRPNYEIYQKIREISNIDIIISGGIKDIEDIKEIKKQKYYGCIVGKAIYENKISRRYA